MNRLRLLADENFPGPSVAMLRNAAFDVIFIAEMAAGWPDRDILDLAVRDQRWVMTFDRDYGELLFAQRRPSPPCALHLRLSHYRPEDPARILLPLLAKPEQFEGNYVVVDAEGYRKRPLLMVV